MKKTRPGIQFIPLSIDAGIIRFFGTLMPALLLLKASPHRFLNYQIDLQRKPPISAQSFIASEKDDASQRSSSPGNMPIFIHWWELVDFDPFTFARAKVFLKQVTRLLYQAGYQAQPLDPLSPDVNLPKLAASAGLGNLSPLAYWSIPSLGHA